MSPRAVTDSTAKDIWETLKTGVSHKWLAERFNVGVKVIEGIAEGRTYREITGGSKVTFEEYTPKARSRSASHPKVRTPKSEMDYVTEHAKCAGCGELFMLDSRFKAARMLDGEYFYCPAGCSLTYDKKKALIEAQEEETGHVVVMTVGDSEISARPAGDDDEVPQWHVGFQGKLQVSTLNEIMNDLFDQLMRIQGLDVEGIAIPYGGTATAYAVGEISKIGESLQTIQDYIGPRA